MFHQELDHTTFLATLETFIAVLFRVHHKAANVPVIVERAKPKVSDTLLFQRNEVAYDVLNLRGVQNLLDDEFVDSFAHSHQK